MFFSDPKIARKDTAAYASSSFFTCQRARPPTRSRQRRPPNRPARLAPAKPSKSPPDGRQSKAAVDEQRSTRTGPPRQHSFRRNSEIFSSDPPHAAKQTKQNRPRKADVFQAEPAEIAKASQPILGSCRQRSPILRKTSRRTRLMAHAREKELSLVPARARPSLHCCLNKSPRYPGRSARPKGAALGCADISDSNFYARGKG